MTHLPPYIFCVHIYSLGSYTIQLPTVRYMVPQCVALYQFVSVLGEARLCVLGSEMVNPQKVFMVVCRPVYIE